MNLKLTGDRVAVLVDSVDSSKTASGILLVTQQVQPNTGEVVSVGPGRLLNTGIQIPVGVQVGERIIFNQHAGSRISMEEQEYLILREGDILAVI